MPMWSGMLLQTIRLGGKSLLLHKLRSALTVLGMVFGVGSVIVMLAIGEGARFEAVQQIEQLGATNIIIRSVRPTTARDAAGTTGAIRYGLSARDIRRLQATIPTVVGLVASREHRRTLRRNASKLEGRVVGVTPEYQQLNRLRVSQGRFISAVDLERLQSVAVLGYEAAAVLFPLEDPIGNVVRVDEDRYFTVVGVMAAATSANAVSNLPAQDNNRDIYIPFTTDRRRFGEIISFDRTGAELPEIVEVSQLNIAVDRMEHVKQSATIVRDVLEDHRAKEDIAVVVPLDLLERAERTQRIYTLVLSAIAGISLLVGGIGIMNIMLATVTERTQEIGIRRALGATRANITAQFLVETVVLAVAGGVIGLLSGVAVAWTLRLMFEIPSIVLWWTPLLAISISLAVGLVFGIFPARRAAFLDPIQALRRE